MSARVVGIVLLVLGLVGLAYGKFSYTKDHHEAKIGSVKLSADEKETVNIPLWAGVGAVVVGAGLLFAGPTRT